LWGTPRKRASIRRRIAKKFLRFRSVVGGKPCIPLLQPLLGLGWINPPSACVEEVRCRQLASAHGGTPYGREYGREAVKGKIPSDINAIC
jgi:hypothetical protein